MQNFLANEAICQKISRKFSWNFKVPFQKSREGRFTKQEFAEVEMREILLSECGFSMLEWQKSVLHSEYLLSWKWTIRTPTSWWESYKSAISTIYCQISFFLYDSDSAYFAKLSFHIGDREGPALYNRMSDPVFPRSFSFPKRSQKWIGNGSHDTYHGDGLPMQLPALAADTISKSS